MGEPGQAVRGGARHGYIFASGETEKGRTYQYHTNVARLKVGDTVFHYARGYVQAISHVSEPAIDATRPVTMEGETPGRIGYLTRTEYRDLTAPIAPVPYGLPYPPHRLRL